MEVDNPDFDPQKHFLDIISSHSLRELLSLETSLISEIRTLDGNMQTLVYENYNKFISATDKIREMKTKVESMEEEINKLALSMGNIESLTDNIETKVRPRQEQVKKLVEEHEQLKKIKFICDLPGLLKASIEENLGKDPVDFSKPARSYAKCASYLEENKQNAAYASIYRETDECVSTIKKVIWNKLQEEIPLDRFTKYSIELGQLGDQSERLANHYLSYYKISVLNSLTKILQEPIDRESLSSPLRMPTILSDSSLDTIEEDVKLTLQESERNPEPERRGTFAWFIRKLHESTVQIFIKGLEGFNKIFEGKFSTNLLGFAKEVLQRYIAELKDKVSQARSELLSFNSALHIMNCDMQKIKKLVPASNAFNVSDKFAELFEHAIQKEVQGYIEGLLSNARIFLIKLYEKLQDEESVTREIIEEAVNETAYNIIYSTIATILELLPLLDCSVDYLTSTTNFISLIVSHIIQFFHFFYSLTVANSIQGVPDKTDSHIQAILELNLTGRYIIAILKLTICLEEIGVPKIINTINQNYTLTGSRRIESKEEIGQSVSHYLGKGKLTYEPAARYKSEEMRDILEKIARPELLTVLKQTQEEILLMYVQHYSLDLTSQLFEYFSKGNWMTTQEPIDISAVTYYIGYCTYHRNFHTYKK